MSEQTPTPEALPVTRERLRDSWRSGTPAPFILKNTEATFKMLASSGVIFSTATLPGLFQAYLRRADSHHRSQFDHQEEIAAAYQDKNLQPILLELLDIAATMESVHDICKHVLSEMPMDPRGRAYDTNPHREFLERGSSYAWGAAGKADRMAWALGKLARKLAATTPG